MRTSSEQTFHHIGIVALHVILAFVSTHHGLHNCLEHVLINNELSRVYPIAVGPFGGMLQKGSIFAKDKVSKKFQMTQIR